MSRLRMAWLLAAMGVSALAAAAVLRSVAADVLFVSAEPDTLRAAAALAPKRALYQVVLAEIAAQEGGDPRAHLRQAARLSPRDAEIRVRLGLEEEVAGDIEAAERQLLAAADASRKYYPRWSLLNFYYRRGDAASVWKWAKLALETSYLDREPIFRLCWQVQPAPAVLLERALPARRPVRLDFAGFLLEQRQWIAAGRLAAQLSTSVSRRESDRFLRYTSRLLEAGYVAEALPVWNALCVRGLLPYPSLDPETGPFLTNGDFREKLTNQGFDWIAHAPPGVTLVQAGSPRLRLDFDGGQPERCELLYQYAPVAGGRRYRLAYRYAVSGSPMSVAPRSTGIRWEVATVSRPEVASVLSAPIAPEETGGREFEFDVPAGAAGIRLALVHRREPGSVRMEGTVELEEVRLGVLDFTKTR